MRLSDYGLDDETEEINAKAVSCVKRAVNGGAYISGSCGPSGKILKPYGDTDPEAMYSSFERQAGALIDAGVDIICVETMADLREASLAIKAAKSIATDLPVIATMAFDKAPRGFYTMRASILPLPRRVSRRQERTLSDPIAVTGLSS